MRTSGNDHADPVITSDDAAIANDGHDSTLDCRRPCVPVLCDRPSKLFSKPLDFRARGAQTGNFDNGISNPQQRALRQGRIAGRDGRTLGAIKALEVAEQRRFLKELKSHSEGSEPSLSTNVRLLKSEMAAPPLAP